MPARRPEVPTSDDLFSAAATKEVPATKIAVPQTTVAPDPSVPHYLLPKDLPRALGRLDSREIDALLIAVIDEVTRRGRLTPTVRAKLLEASRGDGEGQAARTSSKIVPPRRHQAAVADGPGALTVGQTNAVRAAFMAGVKPSTIARQFGISQAAVRSITS